jgi:hypothetical protein
VTIVAGNLGVLSGQREPRLCMAFAREGCRLESGRRMTLITSIVVRLRSKFSAVRIDMAVGAEKFAGPVQGFSSFGLMTSQASQSRVFPLKRKCALLMGFTVKE